MVALLVGLYLFGSLLGGLHYHSHATEHEGAILVAGDSDCWICQHLAGQSTLSPARAERATPQPVAERPLESYVRYADLAPSDFRGRSPPLS